MDDSLFVPYAAEVMIRACNPQGEPDSTVCFTGPYLGLPNHHALVCGHDIQTKHPEACGRNCRPSMEAVSTPREPPFECQHQDCLTAKARAANRSVFFTPQNQKPPPDRSCLLSHVYGINEQADVERISQKDAQFCLRFDDLGVNKVEPVPKLETRAERADRTRRSRSPSLHRRSADTRPSRGTIDEIDIIYVIAKNDVGYEIAMRFTGPEIWRKKDGRFMSREQILEQVDDEELVNALDEFQMASTKKEVFEKLQRARAREVALKDQLQKEKEQRREKQGKKLAEPNTADLLGAQCDGCNKGISIVRFRCVICPQEPGYDLCVWCLTLGKNIAHENGKHEFAELTTATWMHEAQDQALPTEDDDSGNEQEEGVGFGTGEEEAEDSCKCDTFLEYLVKCHHYTISFHPGCHGVGSWQDVGYYPMHKERESYLLDDFQRWECGQQFACETCSSKHSEAPQAFQAQLQERRKAQEQRKVMAKYYRVDEVINKRTEMRKATSDEAREAIEKKYEAIAKEHMEVDEDNGDGDAGLYGFVSNLPARL